MACCAWQNQRLYSFPNQQHFWHKNTSNTNPKCCCHIPAQTKTQSKSNNKNKSLHSSKEWSVGDSSALYRIHAWGSPYFTINQNGNVCVCPWPSDHDNEDLDEIDIVDVIGALHNMGLQLPLVLKFPDIVLHRIQTLQDCFDNAIVQYGYQQTYQGIFPLKCNYDSSLIDKIVEFGGAYNYGLEVGSKAELLYAISKLCANKDALLVCNGYKDTVYIKSALLARRLDMKVVIVIEQLKELDLVIRLSRTLNVEPIIGLRAKLSTKHDSHWAETSGDSGKFGLSATKIINVVHTLKEEKMLHCLKLLHFHIGSQIPSILAIREAMQEGSHIFCELVLMGASMKYIDVGGGLGIDYHGVRDIPNSSSIDYSVQCYANEVVAALKNACLFKGVSHPIILSESGRALASHHSVIAFDVLGEEKRVQPGFSRDLETIVSKGVQTSPSLFKGTVVPNCLNLFGCQTDIKNGYIEAEKLNQVVQNLFRSGFLTLEQKAQAEVFHDSCSLDVQKEEDLSNDLGIKSIPTTYYANLSVFRSIPDSWAIKQIFPIMPLHRLCEKPDVMANFSDLTCDSDGKIEHFMGPCGTAEKVLPVHPLFKGETYLLGLFLSGVYQEALGSAHNLFGKVNVVNVRFKRKSGDGANQTNGISLKRRYFIEQILHGQNCQEVLESMHHNTGAMIANIKREVQDAVNKGHMCSEQAEYFLSNYKENLKSYTYLTR